MILTSSQILITKKKTRKKYLYKKSLLRTIQNYINSSNKKEVICLSQNPSSRPFLSTVKLLDTFQSPKKSSEQSYTPTFPFVLLNSKVSKKQFHTVEKQPSVYKK